MSLALVVFTAAQFHALHAHLMTVRGGRHKNMHLRQTRQVKGERTLRYLHAMKVEGPNKIVGMISGPNLMWEYDLTWNGRRTQLTVRPLNVTPKEDALIGKRFLKDIFERVAEEQAESRNNVTRLKGEYYLKRTAKGMSATHPTCTAAVRAGAVDKRFVANLATWNLELLEGTKDRRPRDPARRSKA